MSNGKTKNATSGLSAEITRRDFIGATLIGAGAALLGAPKSVIAEGLGDEWTGYGGVGDYRNSNGNTADVMQAAHRIRDGAYDHDHSNAIDTGEFYDVVIVGAGFAGMTALYEFKKRKSSGTCLLIDNHPIFGGFAKQNEFDVDGYRVSGPQASLNFALPERHQGIASSYWYELGLPERFEFMRHEGGDPAIIFPRDTSFAAYWAEQTASIGYYFQNSLTNSKGTWVKDIWKDALKRAPWPQDLKTDLLTLRYSDTRYKNEKDEPAWLDSMTYAAFVTRVMGLKSEVLQYITPIMGIVGQSPAVSAYAAAHYGMPGVTRHHVTVEAANRRMSFPGGNATLLRHFVKATIPDAIKGPRSFAAIASNPVEFAALDRSGAPLRMRLSATVVNVIHEGGAGAAEHLSVVYEKGGRLYRIKAKGAVLAIGSWVAKRIVADLPAEYRSAFDQFLYSPILMVNVALRNWRFLDRLGFSAARWFDGFGFYSTIRQPMRVGERSPPFHPDKPTVMTFYVPIQRPELSLADQGPAGRVELYSTSYAEYERRIVAQMQRMFAVGGFDASRDVAGIVLNRWGHPLISPQPGHFFPAQGKPAPRDVIRRRFGRIAFGHSELHDNPNWAGGAAEGARALAQVLDVI